MHFSLRTDSRNDRHIRFTIFADSAKCGQLCMTVDEWKKFSATLLIGARRNESVDASVTHQTALFDREEAFRVLGTDP